jgi:DNA-binding NtrC family response regulator
MDAVSPRTARQPSTWGALIESMLHSLGLELDVTEDPCEVLPKLRRWRSDLVVALALPHDKEFWALLDDLARLSPRVPALVISPEHDSSWVRRIVDRGGAVTLSLPVPATRLHAAVVQALGREAPARGLSILVLRLEGARQPSPDDLSRASSRQPGSRDGTRTRIRPLKVALEEPEREIILRALEAFDWNRYETARALEIDRTTLWKKMVKFGLHQHPKGLASLVRSNQSGARRSVS